MGTCAASSHVSAAGTEGTADFNIPASISAALGCDFAVVVVLRRLVSYITQHKTT